MVSRPQPQLQPLWNHEHYDPCHVIPNHVMATSSCSRSWFLPPEFSSWLSDGKTIWELVCVRNNEKRETTEDKIFLTGKVQAVNQIFRPRQDWPLDFNSTDVPKPVPPPPLVHKTPMFWFSLHSTSWKHDWPVRQRASQNRLEWAIFYVNLILI